MIGVILFLISLISSKKSSSIKKGLSLRTFFFFHVYSLSWSYWNRIIIIWGLSLSCGPLLNILSLWFRTILYFAASCMSILKWDEHINVMIPKISAKIDILRSLRRIIPIDTLRLLDHAYFMAHYKSIVIIIIIII